MIEAITREEIFLAKAIGETVPDLEPIIRQEMFLAKIAGMDIAPPVPVTREEMFLNAIANKEAIDLKPITRKEMFLAKAMGADVEVPTPITRVEFYLSQLTGGGSGGGTYEKYSWEGVFASIDKGTYATDYAIGDTVPLDLGSEGLINMQIAAFDTDDLADGSGKAPITWVGKELLVTPVIPSTTPELGWEGNTIRTYLKETIKPIIPEYVRNNIVEVTKKTMGYNGGYVTHITTDDVWIPSIHETGSAFAQAVTYDSPIVYKEVLFKKSKNVAGTNSYEPYHVRSNQSQAGGGYVYTVNNGANGWSSSTTVKSAYICLCFCI